MTAIELDNVPGEIWQHLAVRNGAWRQPVLASAIPGGGADARVVVLRAADPGARELVFYTDARSAKVAQLDADPDACLVVYDDERRLQVRLYGRANRERNKARLNDWWRQLEPQQQRLYAVDVVADELAETKKGRDNFTAFRVVIERFQCLWIREPVNEAAEFRWRDGRWRPRRVRP